MYRLVSAAQTEVDKLDRRMVVCQHDICRLHVSVNQAMPVQTRKSCKYLLAPTQAFLSGRTPRFAGLSLELKELFQILAVAELPDYTRILQQRGTLKEL